MKWLSILVFSISCSLLWAQETSKVTLSLPAGTAKAAVEQIAKATGAKLAVAAAAENEIVILNVTDAPLESVLERIALVTSCKWVTDSDGIRRLRPDDELRRKQAREELDLKTADVSKALLKLQDTLKPKKEGDSQKEEQGFFMAFGSSTPVSKAIAKLSKNLPASLLAAMKDGDRIVFATSPTHMQRPLGNVGNAISELVEEHNAGVAVQKKVEEKADEAKTNEQKKQEAEMQRIFGDMMGLGSSKNPITAPPAKVLLIATRGGAGFGMMDDGITLTLKVYDANGAVILTGRQSLNGSVFSDFMETRAAVPAGAGAQAPAAQGKVVKLSPITAEFVRFSNLNMMRGGGGSFEKNPSRELTEHLTRPDLYDPLSYVDSEALIALSKNRSTNLIASLPDSVISMMGAFGDKNDVTDEGYYNSLKSGKEVTTTEKDGWIVITPKKPTETRDERLDRVALKALIEGCQDHSMPTLDDMAKYARKNETPFKTPVVLPYLMYFAPNMVNPGMKGPLNWDLLRFYGTLNDMQKGVLANRQPISFSSLMPNQKGVVERLVFGAGAQLLVLSQERPNSEGGFMDMIKAFMPRPSTNYRDEPTEVMPNGLPGSGQVRVNRGDSMFVVPVGQEKADSLRMFGALGTDEFAMLEYFRTDPQFAQFAAEVPKIDQVKAGQRTDWDFTFVVAPDVGAKGSLQDDRIAKDAAVVSVESLPQSWRERVARRLAALKKNPMPFPMGGGGSGPPPAN